MSVTETSTSDGPHVVSYGNPVTAGGEAPLTPPACSPPSGSSFPIGTTPVTCTVVDARQRSASCSFSVVVRSPAKIGATSFVAFGDSITLGQDGNGFSVRGGENGEWLVFPRVILVGREYPTVLQQLLAVRYPTQTIVVRNEGFGGEYAAPLSTLRRFEAVLGSGSPRPEVALIMEGTNDISDGNPTAIGPAVAGLRNMIVAAKGMGVRPYLATIPPMNRDGDRGRRGWATVPLLNTQIRDLASRESVTLVDVHQAFNENLALLGDDGLHPNAEGLALIAKTFFDALVATLETAAPTFRGWSPRR